MCKKIAREMKSGRLLLAGLLAGQLAGIAAQGQALYQQSGTVMVLRGGNGTAFAENFAVRCSHDKVPAVIHFLLALTHVTQLICALAISTCCAGSPVLRGVPGGPGGESLFQRGKRLVEGSPASCR